MNKKIIFCVIGFFCTVNVFAQQLPFGTCGIVNIYDAAGNRTKRVYFCNNGDPYPQKNQTPSTETEINTDKPQTQEFQYVDALYPNPTTGKFFVTFSKSLTDAFISITDNTGRILSRFKVSGNKIDFDLSPYASGMYYVRIEEDGKTITKKIIKQ